MCSSLNQVLLQGQNVQKQQFNQGHNLRTRGQKDKRTNRWQINTALLLALSIGYIYWFDLLV